MLTNQRPKGAVRLYALSSRPRGRGDPKPRRRASGKRREGSKEAHGEASGEGHASIGVLRTAEEDAQVKVLAAMDQATFTDRFLGKTRKKPYPG